MTNPEMPWRIEMRPRTGNEDQAIVVFRNGVTRLATPNEKQIWEYVRWLEKQLTNSSHDR